MTDRPDWTPEMDKAAEAVRNLPPAQADPKFRKDLRAKFMSGAIAAPPERTAPERPEMPALPPRRQVWPVWAGLAAAAMLAVALLTVANRGPAWEVVSGTGLGLAVIDGQDVSLVDLPDGYPIQGGSEITLSPDAGLVLRLDGTALVELTGGTAGQVPGSPGRWWGREVSGRVDFGELRFKSGDSFPGSVVHLTTPEGQVEIRGTLVSVQRDSTGTCVCVLEGTVLAGTSDADLEPITPGYRKVMPSGQPPFIDESKPMHRDGVVAFDNLHGSRLKP